MAVLTMAVLTMATLTMATLTMATLTMAALAMATLTAELKTLMRAGYTWLRVFGLHALTMATLTTGLEVRSTAHLQARALIATTGVPDSIVSWFELELGGGKHHGK
jgi:hypothetical protein